MGTVTRPGDPVHGIGFGFVSGIGTLHFPNGVHRPLGSTFFGFTRFPGCFNGFCGFNRFPRCFNGFCGGFGFNGAGFGNFGWGGGGFGYGYPYAYAIDPYSSYYSTAQGQGTDQQLQSYLEDQQRRNTELELELRNERQRTADREAAQAPPAAPPAPAPREPDGPGTVLIFRDGSRTEVKNYAIIGDTLFEVDTRFTKRVPLSTLDVPATIKVNNDRGVEFSVPGKTVKGG
jgi:hypothetical protein